MRYPPLFIATLFSVAFASTLPFRSGYVVHERRNDLTDWVKARRLDSDRPLPMSVGLTQQNLHKMEEMLMSVSHPDSPTYGKHFTATELIDTFAPSENTITAVTKWLIDSGISCDRLRLSRSKGWIHIDALTSEVENLLRTEYHIYAHPSGTMQIGCHNYSVPSDLRQHIDFIKPTDTHVNNQPTSNTLRKRTDRSSVSTRRQSGQPMTRTTNPSDLNSLGNCSHEITPPCLRALYNFSYIPQSTEKNSFAVAELAPNAILFSDIDKYFSKFLPNRVGERPEFVSIDGGHLQTTNEGLEFNGESALDLQTAMVLTDPQKVTLLQVGDGVQNPTFNNLLDALDSTYCAGDDPAVDGVYPDPKPGGFNGPESCGTAKLPNVLSVSFAVNEVAFPTAYLQRQCDEYCKLGILGLTVVYSTGDSGVAGTFFNGSICLDSAHEQNFNGDIFNPPFPSTCPCVTSVGATQMKPGSTVFDPEVAAILIRNDTKGFSGGGFSNVFPLPSYQKDAVQRYSTNYLSPSPFKPGQFNDSGNARAFPDLSANGLNYTIVVDGDFTLLGGTSASTPTVASMFAMINDARIAKGKKVIGFVNPALYSSRFASAFNDITEGSNPGCGTDGFKAAPGWDPVTGLGTPNFGKMLDLFMSLP